MSIEERYLSGLIAVQYPEPTDPTSMDGVQLAAGPSNTVSDAGGGVRVGRAGVPFQKPSMRDITEPAGAMLDMGAATVKGATQGFIGLPGDLEGIGRLVLEKMGVGVGQDTVLPKTEEVKSWLDSNVGQVGNGQNPYESIGEVVAPGGQVKAVKAAGRGAKALAPKAAKTALDWGEREIAPVGSWVKADFKTADSQPVYQVQELGVNDLYLPELDASGRLQPEKRKYLSEYTERAKSGETPPSISVIEMEDGRLRVVDGHRRVLAAKEAGIDRVRALVSTLIDTPSGKQEATVENLKLKAKEKN